MTPSEFFNVSDLFNVTVLLIQKVSAVPLVCTGIVTGKEANIIDFNALKLGRSHSGAPVGIPV